MDKRKRKRLEAAGWTVGTAEEFLNAENQPGHARMAACARRPKRLADRVANSATGVGKVSKKTAAVIKEMAERYADVLKRLAKK